MAVKKTTQFGSIKISHKVIATVAGNAALECYGVVGLTKKNSLREAVYEVLKKDEMVEGILVVDEENGYRVDVSIIAAADCKITEILSEVQKRVRYVLKQKFNGVEFTSVNIFCQGIKRID